MFEKVKPKNDEKMKLVKERVSKAREAWKKKFEREDKMLIERGQDKST